MKPKSTCHFIITLTSHWPYNAPCRKRIIPFPQPANEAQDFFNSMRYVDDCLRDYIKSLPPHTTVVIYGDHTTNVQDDRVPDRGPGGEEYVPVFIYDTDRDLAELQRTRNDPLATDGRLNLLDISTFLRNRIAAVDAVNAEGKQQPAGAKAAGAPEVKAQRGEPVSGKSAPGNAAGSREPIARRQLASPVTCKLDDP